MNTVPPPFNAQERDIDLLLLEELHHSTSFLALIAKYAGIAPAVLKWARHSVYSGTGEEKGETDILAVIDSPNGRVALMIEDKIGAAMQPDQAKRYHARGEQLCAPGNKEGITSYLTLLCAPANYLAAVPEGDWHKKLKFEDIADWFAKQDDPRAKWRHDALRFAITRQRGSVAEVKDEVLLKFKHDYMSYCRKMHSDFKFTQQSGRDREYYFTGNGVETNVRLKHAFTASKMVLIFEGRWRDAALAMLKSQIPPNMELDPHPSAAHLVVGVEPVDLTEPLEKQTDLIDSAMDKARQLLPFAWMVQQMDTPSSSI